MEVSDFLAQYQSGRRDFKWVNLSGANLIDANLEGVSLYNANLTDAILIRANLRSAKLTRAKLTNANLTDANLTNADLWKADLTNTIMPNGRFYTPPSEPEIDVEPESEIPISFPSHKLNLVRSPDPPPPLPLSKPKNWSEIRERLPIHLILFLILGYAIFSGLLVLMEAHPIVFILLWGSSFLWLLDESWCWVIPLIGSYLLYIQLAPSLLESIFDLTILIIPHLAFVMGVTYSLFYIGSKIIRALRDGMFLIGIISSFMFFITLLARGFTVTALALILGIGFTFLGSMFWYRIEDLAYSRQQAIQINVISSGLGLILGILFGLIAR